MTEPEKTSTERSINMYKFECITDESCEITDCRLLTECSPDGDDNCNPFWHNCNPEYESPDGNSCRPNF